VTQDRRPEAEAERRTSLTGGPATSDLRAEVSKISWYHTIDLGNGIVTPGVFRTNDTLRRLHLPETLQGSTVLDIGAWDGFYSFESERRGAARVLATDHFCWSGDGWGTKAGFDLARSALRSRVEDLDIDVLDLSPERVGTWDVVLFLGVLYHMRHPLLALERVASVTKRCLVLETAVDMLWVGRPAIAFYPETELDRDQTNWFGPNVAAVDGLLRTVGFRRIEVVSVSSLSYRIGRALKWAVTGRGRFVPTLSQGRLVVHAWR